MPSKATDPLPLTIDVVPLDAAAVGVAIVGDVDACTADLLRIRLQDVVDAERPRSVVIDCAGVAFLDAAGITALIRAREHADRQRVDMRLLNTGRMVTRILTLAGLIEALQVTPTPPPPPTR